MRYPVKRVKTPYSVVTACEILFMAAANFAERISFLTPRR